MNLKIKFLCLSILLSLSPDSRAWWDEDPGPAPAPANNPSPFQHWDSSPAPAPASPTTHWDSSPAPAQPTEKPGSILNSMFGPSTPAPAAAPEPEPVQPSILNSMFATKPEPAPAPANSSVPQMQKDWNGFFDQVPAGQVVNVGGGTVVKNADGTATYKDNTGKSYTYNKNTSFDEVARNAPGLGASWSKNYNYGSPASSAPSSNVSTLMQQNYNDFFDKVPAGTVVNVGGGTVTKNADGTATFRNSSGFSYNYNKNTPIDEVAKNAPGLGLSWNRSYGYQAPAIETPFNSLEEFIKWERDLKMNAKFNPNYQSPDYIKMAFMDTGPESAYGRYLFMKNNPQYVKDFENIHKGQLSTHTTDGSTIIKSNIDRMPKEIAEHYRNNPAELRAAEGFGLDPVLARKLYIGEIQLPKDINKTEWLRTHAWTPKGVIEQNNTIAYANAGYRGLNGDGGYLQNRFDPTTGQIVKTPQWEGVIGLEATEDHGGALIGARSSTGSSTAPKNNTGSAFRDSAQNSISNSKENSSFDSFEEFKAWERNIKMNAKFNPNYQSPDYIKIAFMDSGPESAYGRYLFMKNNPQYIQDFENIHKGQLSSHPTDGSTIIKSNIDNMPPDIAEHYRKNPAELRAAEGFSFDPVLARKVYIGEIQLPKDINKTEWLRTHAWTPSGVIEQNNVLALASADYRGLNGDASYNLARIDPATGKIIDDSGSEDANVLNQNSTTLRDEVFMDGVVFSENPNLIKSIGDKSESYSITMLAQNSMYGTSSLSAIDQFSGKFAETIINKCSNNPYVKQAGLDGSYQLYSQACIIYEIVTGSTGIFREMDALEQQIIEDEKAQGQAAKEESDRKQKIEQQKKKILDTNSKIKTAITALKSAKEAQKKAQASLKKAQADLAAANAITCPEDDDGSCASSKAQAVESATKAVEKAEKELKDAEKKLLSAITKMVNLLSDKFNMETSAILAILSGTAHGDTSEGSVQFQVAGTDFTLIDLDSEISKLTGSNSERASQLIGGENAGTQTQDYFESLIDGTSSSNNGNGVASSLGGPNGDAVEEILNVFGSMENGASYLENIALAVTEYAGNEASKQIELLEQMKTPEGRAQQAATRAEEKRKLLENYKKMIQLLLKTLDQNLALYKGLYESTKAAGSEGAKIPYHEYLVTFTSKDLHTKLKEGYFSKVDYLKIHDIHECYITGGNKNQCSLTSNQ